MNEIRRVRVRSGTGALDPLTIEISCDEDPCRLFVSGLGFQNHEFQGDDLFETLIALRLELEKLDFQICCCGAGIDVFPSGMSRSMGSGRKAYITKIGMPATKLVDIFDDSEMGPVGTVEAQEEFHKRWIHSLTK